MAQVFLQSSQATSGTTWTGGCPTVCTEANPCHLLSSATASIDATCVLVLVGSWSETKLYLSMTTASTKLTLTSRGADVSIFEVLVQPNPRDLVDTEIVIDQFNLTAGNIGGQSVTLRSTTLKITKSEFTRRQISEVAILAAEASTVEIDETTFTEFTVYTPGSWNSANVALLMTRSFASFTSRNGLFTIPGSCVVDIDVRATTASGSVAFYDNSDDAGGLRHFSLSDSVWSIGRTTGFPAGNLTFTNVQISNPDAQDYPNVFALTVANPPRRATFNSFACYGCQWAAGVGYMEPTTYILEDSTFTTNTQTYPVRTTSSFVTLHNIQFPNPDNFVLGPRVSISAPAATVTRMDLASMQLPPPRSSQGNAYEIFMPCNATFIKPLTIDRVGLPGNIPCAWTFQDDFELTAELGAAGEASPNLYLSGPKITFGPTQLHGDVHIASPAGSQFIYKAGSTGYMQNLVGSFFMTADNNVIQVDLSGSPVSQTTPRVGDQLPIFWDYQGPAGTFQTTSEYSLTWKNEDDFIWAVFAAVTCNPSCNADHSTPTCASTTRCACIGGYTGTLCDTPPPPASPPASPPTASPVAPTPVDDNSPPPPPPVKAPTGGSSSSLSVRYTAFLIITVAIFVVSGF
jgi:hypothetical protein